MPSLPSLSPEKKNNATVSLHIHQRINFLSSCSTFLHLGMVAELAVSLIKKMLAPHL
jgi:hypothetical protein